MYPRDPTEAPHKEWGEGQGDESSCLPIRSPRHSQRRDRMSESRRKMAVTNQKTLHRGDALHHRISVTRSLADAESEPYRRMVQVERHNKTVLKRSHYGRSNNQYVST